MKIKKAINSSRGIRRPPHSFQGSHRLDRLKWTILALRNGEKRVPMYISDSIPDDEEVAIMSDTFPVPPMLILIGLIDPKQGQLFKSNPRKVPQIDNLSEPVSHRTATSLWHHAPWKLGPSHLYHKDKEKPVQRPGIESGSRVSNQQGNADLQE